MNKTLTINLAKINFYIDENAYRKLDQYLKSISASLDHESRKETLEDIEARIAELFLEKQNTPEEVIGLETVDEIIEVMGQPEDYNLDEAPSEERRETKEDSSKTDHKTAEKPEKKLFRDLDHHVLGGVCAGLSHYLGINMVWVRLIFLAFLFIFPLGISSILFISSNVTVGSSFIIWVYIILWVAVPGARTTAEKLQMQGKKVDISNIEKRVREEYNKLKSESALERFLENLGKALITILKIIAIIIGIFIVFVTGITLIVLFVALLGIGIYSNGGYAGISFDYIQTTLPHWLFFTLIFLAVGIPMLLLFLAGLKIIATKSKIINLSGILGLIGAWVIALMVLAFTSKKIRSFSKSKFVVNTSDSTPLQLKHIDTLYIAGLPSQTSSTSSEKTWVEDGKFLSNEVEFSLSSSKDAELNVHKFLSAALGTTHISADEIQYKSLQSGDSLLLRKLISIDTDENPLNRLKIEAIIKLPDSLPFKIAPGLARQFRNLPESYIGHPLIVKDGTVQCLDCLKKTMENPKKQEESESEWYQENEENNATDTI